MRPPDYLVFMPVPIAAVSAEPDRIERSGGLFALRLLVEQLRALRYQAQLVAVGDSDTVAGCRRALDSGRTTVIYPEPIEGNPLGAREVVRWVLYYASEERVRRWRAAGERVYFYWKQFHPAGESRRILRVIDANLSYFADLGEPRSGVCYRVAKGAEYHVGIDRKWSGHLAKALIAAGLSDGEEKFGGVRRLADGMTLAEMREVFNRARCYVSYDCESAVSVIAALCGCPSVIIPRPNMTRRDLLPCFRYGIAFGFGDLRRAEVTRPLLRDHIARLEQQARRSVASFARDTHGRRA